MVALVHSEEWKKDIDELRSIWRKGEKERRDKHKSDLTTNDKAEIDKHPMECSQRSAVFKYLVEKTAAEDLTDQGSETRESIKALV